MIRRPILFRRRRQPATSIIRRRITAVEPHPVGQLTHLVDLNPMPYVELYPFVSCLFKLIHFFDLKAYSPYVAIPSVDTPGWPHSAGPATRSAPPASCATTSVATPNVGVSANSSGSTCSNADLYGIKKIVLPQKEYEEELKEEKTAPPLLYDYTSMNAWLFHPVKRMKTDKDSHGHTGDRSGESSETGPAGKHLNGNMGSETRESTDYDEEDGSNVNPRKRKGPDSGVRNLFCFFLNSICPCQ